MSICAPSRRIVLNLKDIRVGVFTRSECETIRQYGFVSSLVNDHCRDSEAALAFGMVNIGEDIATIWRPVQPLDEKRVTIRYGMIGDLTEVLGPYIPDMQLPITRSRKSNFTGVRANSRSKHCFVGGWFDQSRLAC
ncbi:MAG: hypothetical protein CME36_11620 [unclassified Hahellaceae]|nr:hypothetical protein [Hahellaceae bacterium]